MTNTAIFWPMIAQALLTFLIYCLVSWRRIGSIKAGTSKAADYRIPTVEPEPSATVVRNLSNQFELPVLFYVVCLSLYITAAAATLAVLLAWGFVVARYAHAFVHVTSNLLRLRRPLFILGLVFVLLLWVVLAVHLATAGAL
ncbi:hypothetical protein DFR52_102222 [Hoeflea marina]|uniref:MAPEG family protein n=1 Tax=Hoeflea marina TaxID=274592 RepID=A0A317PMS1_9HYPH|nr:MAPEG family protein [Hoeflea marina]PWW01559.1 hypothetical protein DFR52_102222 [Hoeflea marina]